jgi:hypothetical protein
MADTRITRSLVALVLGAIGCVDLERPPNIEPCMAGEPCPGPGGPLGAGNQDTAGLAEPAEAGTPPPAVGAVDGGAGAPLDASREPLDMAEPASMDASAKDAAGGGPDGRSRDGGRPRRRDGAVSDTRLGDPAPGAGADPACHDVISQAGIDPVDDMEDLDLALLGRNGRSGAWYALTDATGGAQAPSPLAMTTVAACAGDRGYLRLRGGGFGDWGSSLLLDFVKGKGYDLRGYAGLRFWARNPNASGPPVRVSFPNRDTDPPGGTCDEPAADGSKGCYNAFGRELDELGPGWKLITVMFSELRQQPGWGKRIAGGFDRQEVYSLQFELPADSRYDLWLDDVALVPR